MDTTGNVLCSFKSVQLHCARYNSPVISEHWCKLFLKGSEQPHNFTKLLNWSACYWEIVLPVCSKLFRYTRVFCLWLSTVSVEMCPCLYFHALKFQTLSYNKGSKSPAMVLMALSVESKTWFCCNLPTTHTVVVCISQSPSVFSDFSDCQKIPNLLLEIFMKVKKIR